MTCVTSRGRKRSGSDGRGLLKTQFFREPVGSEYGILAQRWPAALRKVASLKENTCSWSSFQVTQPPQASCKCHLVFLLCRSDSISCRKQSVCSPCKRTLQLSPKNSQLPFKRKHFVVRTSLRCITKAYKKKRICWLVVLWLPDTLNSFFCFLRLRPEQKSRHLGWKYFENGLFPRCDAPLMLQPLGALLALTLKVKVQLLYVVKWALLLQHLTLNVFRQIFCLLML